MERLTRRGVGGIWCVEGSLGRDDEGRLYTEALDRLAAYKDIGADPEEISVQLEILRRYSEAAYGIGLKRLRELAKAEKDGRLVVLPDGVTVRELQDEYCKAKYMAEEQLPSASSTTGHISGFGAGVVHILDKILIGEEAEKAMRKEAKK